MFQGDVTAGTPRPWYNTALVIGPDGSRQYRQAKLYPCCLQDGDHELPVYKYDARQAEAKGSPPYLVHSPAPLPKETLTISTMLCSTRQAQDPRLVDLHL